MRKYICRVMIVVVALLLLGTSLAQPEETKSYPLGTILLFREHNKLVTMIPNSLKSDSLKSDLPSTFDWGPLAQNPLARNITGPARDQGVCGGCWAFGSVACMESLINGLYGLSSMDLSEEVLMSDCCPAGNCDGGYISEAADWMVDVGTTKEACWPYTASNGPCSGFCSVPDMGRIQSWAYVCGNWWTIDINLIKQAIVDHGPLVTGIDIYADFYSYSGGVYQHTSGDYEGGHCVLITGYVDNLSVPGGGYFIAKNSWGTNWGPYDGYFAVAYESNCSFGIESTYYNGIIVY